jgi:hypothetical protein
MQRPEMTRNSAWVSRNAHTNITWPRQEYTVEHHILCLLQLCKDDIVTMLQITSNSSDLCHLMPSPCLCVLLTSPSSDLIYCFTLLHLFYSIFITGHRIDFASVAETKSLPFAFWGTHFLSGLAHSATSWKMVKTEWLKLTVFRRYLAVFFLLADIFGAFITCDCLVSFQLEPINRATNGRWDILRSWCRRRLGHSTPATKGEIDDIARSQKIHPVSATQLAPLGFDTESRPCPHLSTRSM